MPINSDATVVVTDGEQRAALAVVRSLGKAGRRVCVVSSSGKSLAGASRWASAEATARSAYTDPAGFAEDLRGLSRRWSASAVIPITDASLLAALAERESFSPAILPFPALETVRQMADKARVLHEAEGLGIAVPRQWRLDREGAPLPDVTFPVVCKPARSVAGEAGMLKQLKVSYANDRNELEARLAAYPATAYPVLLQQRIVGPGTGVFLLLWERRLVAACAHRRIREKPPSGGVSTYRESVPLDPVLLERSRRLLERLDWSGVAMVEYKIEAATGAPYLMEVNGRFWGSLQLAIDAGVDFPALLVALAHGEPVEAVAAYRTGVRSRWWWGDVDQLLLRLRRSRESLALPPGEPGKLKALGQFLLRRRGDREEILRADDPRPFFRETANWIRGR